MKYTLIFVLLLNFYNKLANCLNASEIDSFVLLHDRVKNTLIEIAINGRCDSPKQTVVYVNETKDKLYLPRATILYRCSDQFACCPNPRHTCMATEKEEVDIGFYILTKTDDQITERSIEVLKFENHTKCSCRRKDDNIPKDLKDILLVSDTKTHEVSLNSSINSTKTVGKAEESTGISSITPKFIEKHIKTENQTNNSTQSPSKNDSGVYRKENSPSTTFKPMRTDQKISTILTSTKIFTLKKTTKPTFLIIKSTPTLTSTTVTSTKTTVPILKTTYKPLITIKKIKISSKHTTKPTTFATTYKQTINTKIKEKEKNLNSITTPNEFTESTEKVVSTTPLSTTQVKSKGTLVPLIKSSINYDELEREEDLKPEEDVIYSNGNGFDLFYTNGIFFRPLTTTPYRSHRSIERVTPKCG